MALENPCNPQKIHLGGVKTPPRCETVSDEILLDAIKRAGPYTGRVLKKEAIDEK